MATPKTEHIHLLILEDMPDIMANLIKDLQEIGFKGTIHQAENVGKAVKICNSEKVDLIISDWNLPDATGFDFLKKIKTIAKFKDTPFLMCTTIDEITNILDAINAGATDYIVKPWDKKELETKFLDCIGKVK